jgi:hypothetical protein
MERRGWKAILIDVRQRAHRSRVADSEQVEVVGMLTVLPENRHGVDAGPVVMNLPLDRPAGRAAVNEVPITPRVPVVAPVWNGWHVAED